MSSVHTSIAPYIYLTMESAENRTTFVRVRATRNSSRGAIFQRNTHVLDKSKFDFVLKVVYATAFKFSLSH